MHVESSPRAVKITRRFGVVDGWILSPEILMLRPHDFGSFVRIWEPSLFDVDIHEDDGYCKYCKYCRWEAGTYHGYFYIRDPSSGWWEDDPKICKCIHFDRCNQLITYGTRFFVRGTLQVHTCDCASHRFVEDEDENHFQWHTVIAIASFSRMYIFGIPRWRQRMLAKDKDTIGRCLSLRDWTRVRRCIVRLKEAVELFQNEMFHGSAWRRVTALYTLDDQLAHDAAFAFTITYLPIGAIVLPVQRLAPTHIDPVGWLWAKFRLPQSTQSSVGWIHPCILEKNELWAV